VVTGVSGSGKSSLIKGILYPAVKRHLGEVCDAPGEYAELAGDWQSIKNIEFVDQKPDRKKHAFEPCNLFEGLRRNTPTVLRATACPANGFTPDNTSHSMPTADDATSARVRE